MMKTLKLKSAQNFLALGLMCALLTTASCQQVKENNDQQKDTGTPAKPIQEAAFFGDIKAISAHVAANSDLNEKDAYGSTPLHIAATFGKTEAALLLIENGADISATSADGSTPLHTAAFYGRVDIVKALLNENADVTIKNTYNSTALESVTAPFDAVKPIYDQISKDLGPLGLKLDYDRLKESRAKIAEMIRDYGKK